MTAKTAPTNKNAPPIKPWVLFLVLLGVGAVALGLAVLVGTLALPAAIDQQRQKSESSAVTALKVIAEAQTKVHQSDKDGNGLNDFVDLKTLAAAGAVEATLGKGVRNGYKFSCDAGRDNPKALWWAKASPLDNNPNGRHFFINQSGKVYVSTGDFKVDLAKATPTQKLTELRFKATPVEDQ